MRHDYKLEIIRDMVTNLKLYRDMGTNLKLYKIWLQTWNYKRHGNKLYKRHGKTIWNYKRHGKKLEIIRYMITNLKL